jgi:hypothetical protein
MTVSSSLALAGAGLLVLVPPSPTPSPVPELRSLYFVAVDQKGGPEGGLAPEEVAVLEDGVARVVSTVEPDTRPLTLMLLLDSSQKMGPSFRLELVDGVSHFLPTLPLGTQFTIWICGERPRKIVDFTDDAPEAVRALRKVFPEGGNTLLDAIPEASRELKKKEGIRSAMIILTGIGEDVSNRDQFRAVDESVRNATTFMALEFEEGGALFETRTKYDFTLGALTSRTGGIYERLLTPMGTKDALDKVGAALRSTYKVKYASGGGDPKKLTVVVARPGVKVILGTDQKGNAS